jgi:hypothetical protein
MRHARCIYGDLGWREGSAYCNVAQEVSQDDGIAYSAFKPFVGSLVSVCEMNLYFTHCKLDCLERPLSVINS